ncbi:uncharacterized protein LOC120268528 [Dioscorea cayenensis subsp. rotundata]|uniref:Uncharacterized protein LOC120268528 n=1 Tax=Dioscorea cayennensis subsp. rotundata TaxID=55577 RepID=A0AB40BZ97_DIOCR|nr:uncharacterized protein LOC120268528 [Dioscorea cayenensis subsp. rotundata]
MREGERVQQYVSRIIILVNKINGLGYDLEEKEVGSKVTRSLTPKYDHMITSMKEARDVDQLSLDELSGILQAYEAIFDRFVDQQTYKVLYVKGEASISSGGPQECENWPTDFNRERCRGFKGRGRGYDGG